MGFPYFCFTFFATLGGDEGLCTSTLQAFNLNFNELKFNFGLLIAVLDFFAALVVYFVQYPRANSLFVSGAGLHSGNKRRAKPNVWSRLKSFAKLFFRKALSV